MFLPAAAAFLTVSVLRLCLPVFSKYLFAITVPPATIPLLIIRIFDLQRNRWFDLRIYQKIFETLLPQIFV